MLSPNTQWKIPKNPIHIKPKVIHIWVADILSYSTLHLEQLKQCLSQDELEHASRYYFEKDKKYYITSRGILRKILSNYLTMKPEKIKFSYNPYGKPYLCNKFHTKNFNFNLSHSGDLALYIFSANFDVGIDLEKFQLIEGFIDIAMQFFSPNEFLKLKSIPHDQQLTAFFKCWTRKEAFIKAIGNGLSHPLDQFEVTLAPNETAMFVNIISKSTAASEWSLYSFTPKPNYEASFAFKGKCEKIEFFQYEE